LWLSFVKPLCVSEPVVPRPAVVFQVNDFFGKIVPGLFTYSKYRPDVVKSLVKKQRKAKLRGQPLQKVFLILEDLMYDQRMLRKDKFLAYVFMNGRHIKVTLVISSQYAMSLPPEFRSQVKPFSRPAPPDRKCINAYRHKVCCRSTMLTCSSYRAGETGR